MMAGRLAIGASHRFETRLSPHDCAERLGQRFHPLVRPGRADASGFWTATGLRTVIRIRGVFTLAENGLTSVDYWIELRPYLMVAWLVVTPVSFGILIVGFILAHVPLTDLWLFALAAVVLIAPTVYISKRQSQLLVAFVRHELEALAN
jgi:hypothetical protein